MNELRGKTLVARFGGYRTITTSSLWQYDYGQTLKLEGLTLPEAYEVHFSKSDGVGTAITQIGNSEGVVIPDMLLLTPGPIYAWIYLHEGNDDGETEFKLTIPVNARVRPTDDEPTPVEQSAITEAIAVLNVAVEETAADALKAEGYALGTQNGDAVSSDSTYFENNAKYFAVAAKKESIEAMEKAISAKRIAEEARDEFLNLNIQAQTLPAGSNATVVYDSGVMTLGIPRGDTGEKGATGATGAKGDRGAGVAAGGRTGQVLKKKTDSDYDTEWTDEVLPVRFYVCRSGEYMTTTKMPIIADPDPATFYLVPDGTGSPVWPR